MHLGAMLCASQGFYDQHPDRQHCFAEASVGKQYVEAVEALENVALLLSQRKRDVQFPVRYGGEYL